MVNILNKYIWVGFGFALLFFYQLLPCSDPRVEVLSQRGQAPRIRAPALAPLSREKLVLQDVQAAGPSSAVTRIYSLVTLVIL